MRNIIARIFKPDKDKPFYTQGATELSKKMGELAALEIFNVFRTFHTSANGLTS
jgi:hypothetical protein